MYLYLLFSLFCSVNCAILQAVAPEWRTDYAKVIEQAGKEQKGVVLFFTGDFCRFCKELEHNTLDTELFVKSSAPHLLFVKIDQPSPPKKLSPEVAAQNKTLRDRYKIKSYPTLVILNSRGEEMGRSAYRAIGGKQYADELLKILKG